MPKGIGEMVTAQLPGADTPLEAGSQVLLYLGGEAPQTVTVPDFTGMTPDGAAEAARDAGLTLKTAGNPSEDPTLRVQFQDLPAGTEAQPGTVITITFTDPTARD